MMIQKRTLASVEGGIGPDPHTLYEYTGQEPGKYGASALPVFLVLIAYSAGSGEASSFRQWVVHHRPCAMGQISPSVCPF